MSRHLIAAGLLAGFAAMHSAASAQGGPPIAYVKHEGTGSAIYLTNEDGSSTAKLYATAGKTRISAIDLKPGGGEIAFVERRNGSPWVIRILNFDASGKASGPARDLGGPCYPSNLDYHPTEPVLIIADVCNQRMNIARIGTDGSNHQKLQESPSPPPNEWWFDQPRWLMDGSTYVYARAVDTAGQQLCRNDCAGPDLLWEGYQVGRMDVARTGNRILFDGGTNYISELDADSGLLRRNIIAGIGGHYSHDDSRILYATPHSAKGNHLQIWSPGGTSRISPKGDYNQFDWRS